MPPATAPTAVYFYPRSPCGERPPRGGSCYLDNIISIHALLAESDHPIGILVRVVEISIHALLAESDPLTSRTKTVSAISIHALLAESDPGENLINGIRLVISIHALLAESD